MPRIFIHSKEKQCCNCEHYDQYVSSKKGNTPFYTPPNMGFCAEQRTHTKATKRACKEFVKATPINRYA